MIAHFSVCRGGDRQPTSAGTHRLFSLAAKAKAVRECDGSVSADDKDVGRLIAPTSIGLLAKQLYAVVLESARATLYIVSQGF